MTNIKVTGYEYIISNDSCNGEEEQFKSWVQEKYPEMQTSIQNVYRSKFVDPNGDDIDEDYFFGKSLWEQYCNA